MHTNVHDRPAAVAEVRLPAPLGREERRARLMAAIVFVAAAAITIRGSFQMSGGMPMPGGWTMPMMWMVMPGQSVTGSAWMFLLMWEAMMIAMMLPSSWPMLELYYRTAVSTGQPKPWVNVTLAGCGYFAVWLAFGAGGFGAGFWISSAAMQSERVSRVIPAAAGAALIFAGVYQLSPLKQACLQHCRSPLLFLGHVWRPGWPGAVRIGIIHGAFCAACCWALMVMQMILGVMNLAVMAAIAAVIGVEKLWRRGLLLARVVGVVSIAAGILIAAKTFL